jgi:hypothetical protein
LRAGHIATKALRIGAYRGGRFTSSLFVEINDGHHRTRTGQSMGEALAKDACPSRDECCLAV